MDTVLTEAEVNILRALREGAELTRHLRTERGPYYMLAGRRLSMPLVKRLEAQRLIVRTGQTGGATVPYTLTSAGMDALRHSEGES